MIYRTGSIGLDRALGGGWTGGTMNEIWGDPGSGKTILGLHTVESAVRAHKDVLWIDLCDGVRHMDNAPQVVVGRPRNAEDVFSMALAGCQWPDIGLVVVDPTQHLTRQREIDGDPGYVPHPQREYRRELNDLKVAASVSGTVVLFISQPRDKDRQPVRGTGISEKVLYRVHLHPDVVHQDGTRMIQATVKNVPGKSVTHNAARFLVEPGKGINQSLELVQAGIEFGNIQKRGSWLQFGGLRAQGVGEMARALSEPGNGQVRYVLDMTVRKVAGIS